MVLSFLFGAPDAWSRPVIGLVLSGGGARGAAHVGVIQVLEEMNIPVDFIAGTSMGSIIGGLYAIGTPPEDIESLTTKVDWSDMFIDTIPREKQSYRAKAGKENYLLSASFDSKKGLGLPKGLVSGKKLDLTLRALTLGAGEDFNAFPIPFRAVATNLETGKMVVLDKGDLAKSLRASMAIPIAFSPVLINGIQLVDGGVSRNLPIDVARQMGADVVIAVNIGTPLYTADKIDNVLNIADQTTGFLTNQNVEEQIKTLRKVDTLISPDLGDITTASFTRMNEAVEIGRKAALAMTEELKRYSISPEEYKAFRQHQLKASHRPGKIEFVEVTHKKEIINTNIFSRYINYLFQKTRGKQTEADVLAQSIFLIYDREDLKDIDFKLIEKDGKQGILLEPVPKENINHNIDFGFQMSNDFQGNNSYDIQLEYRMTHINRLGAEWKNKFQFGERILALTEFYQPLEASAWRIFLAPYGQYQTTPYYLYDGSSRLAQYQLKDICAGFDMGYQFAEFGELRFGFFTGSTDTELQTGAPYYPENTFDNAGYKASLAIDQLDNTRFPHKGFGLQAIFTGGMTSLGADENYYTIETKGILPISFGRSTIIAKARWDSLLSSTRDYNNLFFLGGFLDLSGMATNQIYGQQLIYGELIYLYKILKQKVFNNDLYAGFSVETGNTWMNRSDMSIEELRGACSIFLGADSIIGPVYLGYGHAEGGYNALYFYIGSFF
jgi:NTE family protein